MDLDQIKRHIRDMDYMDGIERDRVRRLHTSEFFTPTTMVQEILDHYDQSLFADPTSIWCDNSCGDGQFLGEILIRKLENGIEFDVALGSIFGVDIMKDNVNRCRDRLSCGMPTAAKIVKKNIVHADSLDYDYRFGQKRIRGGGTLIFG